jgi:hypothetical protein
MKFVFDGRKCPEQEIASVGEDGTATRSDAVLREKLEESGEEFIYVFGGGEFFDVGREFFGKVLLGFLGWRRKVRVAVAEIRGLVGDGETATPIAGMAVQATG